MIAPRLDDYREVAPKGTVELLVRLAARLQGRAFLHINATRFGGGFVQSIDGLAAGTNGGRRSDWFFYVNGIESPIGSAEYDPSGGDRIWWDYRDWSAAI